MPELPEVETVVRGLRRKTLGRRIETIDCLRAGTVRDNRGEQGEFGRITRIRRRGKYILLDTDNDLTIVIHLRMTGKLIFEAARAQESEHCRAVIRFGDGSYLQFDDVRTFGKIEIYKKGEEEERFRGLGVEPLSVEFSDLYLEEHLRKRKAPIKNVLLDQRVIAGLGNIYASEILYRAGISPLRESAGLSAGEIRQIVQETRKVLEAAIEKNGTTISDYRSVEDKTGEFQNFLQVYGKRRCSCGGEIKKIKQAGRSSYYCSVCQK